MKTRYLILLFLVIDLVMANLSVSVFALPNHSWSFGVAKDYSTFYILFNVCWIFAYLVYIDGTRSLKSDLWKIFKTLLKKFVLFIALLCAGIIILSIKNISPGILFGAVAMFFLFILVLSLFYFYSFAFKGRKDWYPTVIIGDNWMGRQLYRYLEKKPHLGFTPIGILDDSFGDSSRSDVLGKISDFQPVYDNYPFNNVIIALPLTETEKIKQIILVAERNGVRPRILPHYFGWINRKFNVQSLGSIPLLNLRSVPLDEYPNRFWKRAFDIVFSGFMLILLSPLLILIAISVKISGKGPVFYKPLRLGIDGEPFVLYKFRTMVHSDDPYLGTNSTIKDDPRVTKLGKFLRKYNLDELPQLLNVLKNEMSIVGPRPHRVYLNKTLKEKMNTYMIRSYVKPGITGWAQINGWRGPTATKMQYMGRTLHDLWYIEHWSFGLDLYIIFLTAFGKKVRKNAF